MLVVTDPRLLVEDLLESLEWKASLPWPSASMSCSRKLSCPCSGAATLRLLDSVGGDSPSLKEYIEAVSPYESHSSGLRCSSELSTVVLAGSTKNQASAAGWHEFPAD